MCLYVGVTSMNTVEIGIGVESNTRCVMRDGVGGEEVSGTPLPMMLSCSRETYFWVTADPDRGRSFNLCYNFNMNGLILEELLKWRSFN